jgi:hypothetical protein
VGGTAEKADGPPTVKGVSSAKISMLRAGFRGKALSGESKEFGEPKDSGDPKPKLEGLVSVGELATGDESAQSGAKW